MPLLRALCRAALVLTVLVATCVAAWSQQNHIVPTGTAAATHKRVVERIDGRRRGSSYGDGALTPSEQEALFRRFIRWKQTAGL
jgi:hypothetical protein